MKRRTAPVAFDAAPVAKRPQPEPAMRNRIVAAVLALVLGSLGAHKFYLGRHLAGVLYLLFSWTFIPAILGVFEGIGYLIMDQNEFDRSYNGRALPGGQVGWAAPTHTWQRPDQGHGNAGAQPLGAAQLGEELRHLNELHIAGLLTDEEFAQQKARLLSRS